ncbi:phage holin family protein [Microbacterium sp. GXF0217]
MRNGIIRFGALYVFNVAVLLIIGLVLPSVSVGWHALWASVILTLAALFIKPLLKGAFQKSAAKSAADRTKTGEKVVQYALVYVVELIIWVLTVWLSPVGVHGFFWGYALPPLLLLLGWVIYDQVDDVLRRKAGEVYDKVSGGMKSKDAAASASRPEPAARVDVEPDDGLTPEQRRMLDEL